MDGVADIDTDSDGFEDCIDSCDEDPDKIEPGICVVLLILILILME